MKPTVELINNPYTQRLRILINGEAISVYSNLEKYIEEPFSYWCDRILDTIFEECNHDPFRLHFRSKQEEVAVMEKLAADYSNCVQFSSGPLLRPTPLLERIKGLNRMIRQNHIVGFEVIKIRALFVIPESLKRLEPDLTGIEVKNVFCQLVSEVMCYQDYQKSQKDSDVIFLISDGKALEDCMQRLNIHRGFGIYLGKQNAFSDKREDVFIYESTEDTIFDTIFECLLLSPLSDAFCRCIRSLPSDTASKFKEQIEELQSISLKVIPRPETTTVEVGRSSRIQFVTDLEGYEIKGSQLHYSYSEKGIIRCNGLLVEGLKAGKTVLNIYKEGEQLPCAKVDYTVIKRNRISELKLEDRMIYIGEGDRVRMKYTFLPVDADNKDTIVWESDHPDIATVDRYGNLYAVKKGTCTIWCYAEQVSASCSCTVKPHLKSITPDFTEIDMIYCQEKAIQMNLMPEDCIDGQIAISSMNMQIANVVGQTIKAVGIGDTRIIIQNIEETVRAEIAVHVMSEKDFRKKQKQKDKELKKNAADLEAKKGWISKLFG